MEPTQPRKGWPNHRGLRPLLFSNSGVGFGVGFFYVPQEPDKWKCCETGPTPSFSHPYQKTRKSNRLQKS